MNKKANVYLIFDKASNAVKIGKGDPIERMKSLQTGNSHALGIINVIPCRNEKAAMNFESFLHKKYEANRIYWHPEKPSEWFHWKEGLYEEFENDHDSIENKSNRESLTVKNLWGKVTTIFGSADGRPICHFYPDQFAQITRSYEASIKAKIKHRTMSFPTNGKSLLLPYSNETDRVFISQRKHLENIELNNFNKIDSNSLDNFITKGA